MSLEGVSDLEARVDEKLQSIASAAQGREEQFREAEEMVLKDPSLHITVEKLNHIHSKKIPALLESVGKVAQNVSGFATETQERAQRLKQLHRLLERVEAAKQVAGSLLQMEKSTQAVEQALGEGDRARIVELILAYEAARERVLGPSTSQGGAVNAESPLPPVSMDSSSAVVERARERVTAMLKADTESASDKEALVNSTTLLSKLGHSAEAATMYSKQICAGVMAPLLAMVQEEIAKMDTPHAAQSHLVLLSQLLDAVAGTYESEQSFVMSQFGEEGRVTLLDALHQEATQACVPVVQDFIRRRQDVATSLQEALKARQLAAANAERSAANAGRGSPRPAAAAAASSSASVTAAALASVSRRADQALEDISHIASCCQIYFRFYDAQRQNTPSDNSGGSTGHHNKNRNSSDEAGDGKEDGADHLWESQDNALLREVQQVLGMYCPIQLNYFAVAFSQAETLQKELIAEKVAALASKMERADAKNRRGGGGGGGGGAAQEGSSLMANLANFYMDTKSPAEEEEELRERAYYEHADIITLPDDVFYVLRMAVHRAFNTKSTQVVSAVLAFTGDLVRESFLPAVEKFIQFSQSGAIQPSVLQWISAAHKSVGYTNKLSEELLRLASAGYSGESVLQRFREQSADMSACGKLLEKKVTAWLERCAAVVFDTISPTHLEKLRALEYEMTEEKLFFYELNDPWAQGFLLECRVIVEDVQKVLDRGTFDQFLVQLTRMTVKTLRQIYSTKSFNAFGALQMDKDVRSVCYLLSNFAHEVSLREVYASLTLTSSLLLVDRPRDALDETHNTSLTAEEKKQVLMQRVDLNRNEILTLKL